VEAKMAFFRATIGFCHRQIYELVNEKTTVVFRAWENGKSPLAQRV
jgi:hypothetical protein